MPLSMARATQPPVSHHVCLNAPPFRLPCLAHRICPCLLPAAHHPPTHVVDLTIQPAPAAAFVHVSFGLNLCNPQLNVATFNKPGIRALFAQSIKNIATGEQVA